MENKTAVASYPKIIRLGTTTTSTTTTTTITTVTSSTSNSDTATDNTKKQATNGFSFRNLRKHQNKIKEEIKRLVESKMNNNNNNRRLDIDEGYDTLNYGSGHDEGIDLPDDKEDTTNDGATSREEESIPDFVVPFSLLKKNKIYKSDIKKELLDLTNKEEKLSLEVEVDNLRKELSKLKAILESKPPKKKILKKIKSVIKVKTTTSKPQRKTTTTTTTSKTTSTTTTAKIPKKKRKNYDAYPRIWDGPQPNCAWDGPGGCGGGFDDYYDDKEENRENSPAISKQLRLPDISSRRIDIDDEDFLILDEDKFDKSKLLPGKNVKDKIREHLRQKELSKKKENKMTLASSPPVQPGIIQSEVRDSGDANRLVNPEISSEDYKIYSVDEWLKMG